VQRFEGRWLIFFNPVHRGKSVLLSDRLNDRRRIPRDEYTVHNELQLLTVSSLSPGLARGPETQNTYDQMTSVCDVMSGIFSYSWCSYNPRIPIMTAFQRWHRRSVCRLMSIVHRAYFQILNDPKLYKVLYKAQNGRKRGPCHE